MEVSAAVEDYLRAIYKAASAGRPLTASELAARRGVSGATVSVMLRRLSDAGLLARGERGELRLSPDGEAAALRVVRRHRLLETFLVEVVGLGWDEVDAEADALEHCVSPRLEARIDELLGHPARDPHGDPIPAAGAASHVEDWSEPLAAAPTGSAFRVRRVSDRDPAALRHLADLGVLPGVTLTVTRQDPFGGPLWISLDGVDVPLPPALVALLHGSPEVPA